MHAQRDNKPTLGHDEKTALMQRVRMLLEGVDLMNADELQRARELLQRENIPQWTLFALKEAPSTTEAGLGWGERRLQELRDSGELP